MPLIINHTELDVPSLITRLQELIAKPVRRENIEDLAEIYEQLEELRNEVDELQSGLEELVSLVEQANDNYETWADEENDRDTRMEAREAIEGASTDIDSVLGQIDQFIEESE